MERFSAPVREWFAATFGEPTPPQREGWAAIASGADTLICAPTGSGKTLAAFLWSIDQLLRRPGLPDETAVVYVSPLKALGNDVQRNLVEPLAQIRRLHPGLPEVRVLVRSGDTPQPEREAMVRRPPHILITTPESLYILLTARRSRAFLRTARTVIVDEIHAVAPDKRGSHLALSLERLDRAAGRRLQRIGLSATVRPAEEVARLLCGTGRACRIVDAGHCRDWDLSVWVPSQPLGPIATHELRAEVLDQVAALARRHRSTLVFVNTRRLAERVAHQLTQRLGEGRVAAHHGSLSRRIRLAAEAGLKSGQIPVVVATASLELGIDVGHVDLVCHLGAPRSIATMLQRVGRSGHGVLGLPKGVLFPLTRDELLQCAACVRAALGGGLDRLTVPSKPLDVLAQQLVAECAAGEASEEELWELVRRAHPYRDLTREEWEDVLDMLSEGVATSRGRRGAWLHRDRVYGVLRARRGARLAAVTSGGAIPDTADYDVVEDPTGAFIGKVNEDFAIESTAGDVFLLGNTSWRVRRVEAGTVRVEDASGQAPTVPFWLGEAPARTRELSEAVSELRELVARGEVDLVGECGLSAEAAEQLAAYVAETVTALGCVPTTRRVVAERFFDEAGGMQLVLHAPFGGRINRAWGLALRKRFCVTFDFELQAAATDDGVVLSLGEQHSFPLEAVFSFVRTPVLAETLTQAVLQSPVFGTRFRWAASRALALLRHQGGRRVPAPIQRMRAEDLLAAVFPEQVACQDNRGGGPITPPGHPLVTEALRDCLTEWMDADGLRRVLEDLEAGRIETVAVETPQPSPMSHEILNANPYAFLDDAPLEERRARAVALRRLDPSLARGPGALDPAAVQEVVRQAAPDIRDAEELHDHLLTVVLLPVCEQWEVWAGELVAARRATVACWDGRRAWVAAERCHWVQAALPGVRFEPELPPPLSRAPVPDDPLRAVVAGWMQHLGPVTVGELARILGLPPGPLEGALAALEASGVVLRGRFRGGAEGTEWCDRRLLARIHRLTVQALRREIQPVPAADFVRFLLRWQHVQPGTQLHGREGLLQVVRQLQGFEAPAPAWEAWLLPVRVAGYRPEDLEWLCLSGEVAWGRLSVEDEEDEAGPARGGVWGRAARGGASGRAARGGDGLRVAWGGDGLRAARGTEASPVALGGDGWPAPRGEGSPAPRGEGSPAAFAGGGSGRRPRPSPTRSTPVTFLVREDLPLLLPPLRAEAVRLSAAAHDVARFLAERGASFLADIARGTGRLAAEVEEALWELVSAGLVSGDGVAGLRALLDGRLRHRRGHLRPLPGRPARPLPAGRWSLWRAGPKVAPLHDRTEAFARQLLRRYGVVFRELVTRERQAPSWRALVDVYRRWEACQQVRGGRFVSGFVGEQFALPEAVEALRAVRRQEGEEVVVVSAADPANLAGIVVPGPRVPARWGLAVAYRNGQVMDAGPLGEVRSRLRAARIRADA